MIEEAQSNLRGRSSNFSFNVLDAHTIANVSDSFDGVIANHMLYQVDDREKMFSVIRSVLKDGGSL